MTQVLAQMAEHQAYQNNHEHRNEGNARVTVKDFLSLGPRNFASPTEQLEADDWLREMERTLAIAHVAEHDRVPYVSYLLRGKSASWWENFQAMRAPGVVTTLGGFQGSLPAPPHPRRSHGQDARAV